MIPIFNPDSTVASLSDRVETYFSDHDIYVDHDWEVVESDGYGFLFYLGEDLYMKVVDNDNNVDFVDYYAIDEIEYDNHIAQAEAFSWPARYMHIVDNEDQEPVTEYIARFTFPIDEMSTLAYSDPKSDEYYAVALDYTHKFILGIKTFSQLFEYELYVMPVFRIETTGEWFVDLEIEIQLLEEHDNVLLYNFVDTKLSRFIKESGQTTGEIQIASLDTYTEISDYSDLFTDFWARYIEEKRPLTFNAIPLNNPDSTVTSLETRVEQYFSDEKINTDYVWEVLEAEDNNRGMLFYLGENLFSKIADTEPDFVDYSLISDYEDEVEQEKVFSWPARYMGLVFSGEPVSVAEYIARFTFPIEEMSSFAYTDPTSDEYYTVALDYAYEFIVGIESFIDFYDYELFVMPVFNADADGQWFVDLEVEVNLNEEHDTVLLYNFIDYKLSRFIKESGQTTGEIRIATLDNYKGMYDNLFDDFAIKLEEYVEQKELVTTTAEPTLEPTTQGPTTKGPTTQAPTTKEPTTQAPTTQAPTTKEPTTQSPTTKEPTTLAPTTKEPTTQAPTTKEPTTKSPTTKEPTTQAPTTKEPTTQAPTTKEPTTQVPTTVAPTTAEPTTTTADPSGTTVEPTTTEPPADPIEMAVSLAVPLSLDLDSMSDDDKAAASQSIADGLQADMEALNPFAGGETTIEVELRAGTGSARRRRETSSAVADVTVTYSTPPGADLSDIEIPETTDFASDFTDAAKSSLEADTFADLVDASQLDSISANVEVEIPEVDPADLVCTGDETFQESLVTCGTGEFGLSVPRCVFITKRLDDKIDNEIYLTPDTSETQCYGAKILDTVYFDATQDGCSRTETNGTHLIRHSTMVYQRGTENAVISRKSSVRVNFACAIPLTIYVALENGIASSIINIEETIDHEAMEIDIVMGLFESNTFETQVTTVPIYDVGEPMFVGVSMENAGEMELRLKTCWATPE